MIHNTQSQCDSSFKTMFNSKMSKEKKMQTFDQICDKVGEKLNNASHLMMLPPFYVFMFIKHRKEEGDLIAEMMQKLLNLYDHDHLFDEFLCQETNAYEAYGKAFIDSLPKEEDLALQTKNYIKLSQRYQSIKSDMEDKYLENYV